MILNKVFTDLASTPYRKKNLPTLTYIQKFKHIFIYVITEP